jgi:hypothetical protein
MPSGKALASEPWQPLARQQAREFPGMISNIDPHDLVAGAMAFQENLLPRRPGTLETRGPLRILRFED